MYLDDLILFPKEATNHERNSTTKSRKNQYTRRKENLPGLENIGSGLHQTSVVERKILKRICQENEKTIRNQTI